jgi:hypothetical protein
MMTKDSTVIAHTVTIARKKRRIMYDSTDTYLWAE